MPGGISGVIMAEVAEITEEKGVEKPFPIIWGTRYFASLAASARLEPDMPPMMADSSTFTRASPRASARSAPRRSRRCGPTRRSSS